MSKALLISKKKVCLNIMILPDQHLHHSTDQVHHTLPHPLVVHIHHLAHHIHLPAHLILPQVQLINLR